MSVPVYEEHKCRGAKKYTITDSSFPWSQWSQNKRRQNKCLFRNLDNNVVTGLNR